MTATVLPPGEILWCFSTLGCPAATLPAVAALAHQHGIPAVELRSVNGRMDLPMFFAEAGHTPDSLAAWFRQQQLRVVALDTSARLLDASDDHRRELLAFAPWAEALGTRHLRIFDGGHADRGPTPAQLDHGARLLEWWRAQQQDRGWKVDLIIETHDALVRTEHLQAFVDRADVPVHLLWDSHHTWRQGGEPPLQTWEALRPHIRHVHFKDSIPDEAPTGHPFTYVNLGDGEFPLAALFQQLREDNFPGPVSLEWERAWHSYLGPLEVPLKRLHRWR